MIFPLDTITNFEVQWRPNFSNPPREAKIASKIEGVIHSSEVKSKGNEFRFE